MDNFFLLVFLGAIVLAVAILAVAVIFKGQRVATGDFPYIPKQTLLSRAEQNFLRALEANIAPEFRIFSKTRLWDLMKVKSGISASRRSSAQNRIQSKHADFVICTKSDSAIRCVIELDDGSHNSQKAKARDAEKDAILEAAGIPLIRILAKGEYDSSLFRAEIVPALRKVG